MKHIILIPAFKPDEKLINLLKSIPKTFDVIVVDDGSKEAYHEIFNRCREYAHVISYQGNRGKGYALKTGLSYIENKYQDYIIVTMDCDGQHKIEDAIKLCDYVETNPDTLALGRRTWNKETPLKSRIGNYITRRVYYHVTRLKIYDTQTGLRAFSNKLSDYMLNTPGNRYEYEMNVLLNLNNKNIKYHEIPISTIYFDKNRGSHFKIIKDSYRIYKAIFKWKKYNN